MSAHTLIATLAPALLAMSAPGGFRLEYRYNLATLTGDVRTTGAYLSYDRNADEVYLVGYGRARVFNASGMEVYRFGDDSALGTVYGVAALENGDLMVATFRDGKPALARCNFRGEVLETVELTGVPPAFEAMGANAIAYLDGRVYLADLTGMRVLVVDPAGRYLASYDLAALLGFDEKKRAETGLFGFSVDPRGNLLFTIAPLFTAYVLSPAGELRSFGKPGSAPGQFNIATGIAADDRGNLYVVDSLKCAVIVFDKDFQFLGEFGYRGRAPGQLIAPREIAVGRGSIYVSQGGDRGVAVYRIVAG